MLSGGDVLSVLKEGISDCDVERVCSLRRRLERKEAMRLVEERKTLCWIERVKGERVCCAMANSCNFSRFLAEKSGLNGSFVSVSKE